MTADAPTPALLVAEDLVKRFGPTEALRGASVSIQSGEIVAIMGPSGSGKSTLLHCLAGILLSDSGTALFAGRDLRRMSEKERSRLRLSEFGFVFQHGQLVPDLPGEENVALPLLLRGENRRKAIDTAREWLHALDVVEAIGKLPGELSGGQAQRVALARAFAIQPRVIFADEPTGSLDSLSGEAVMELLTAAARDQGTTVIIVTHDARVAAYANREVVVRDGRVTAGMAL
ncbi:MAG: ABC transporter ATP-binding protein [Dehalococcoidia bacterium]|nr:ABC transporter ATP-binding protein [Dehalococcoidia bacterium]